MGFNSGFKGLKDKKSNSWEKDTRLAQLIFNPYSTNVEIW